MSRSGRIGLILVLCLYVSWDRLHQRWVVQPTLLEEIQKSGNLRVLTRYDLSTYYEGPEGYTGLEFDLVQLFAKRIGVTAEFIVPENFGQIIGRILVGDGDIAAAGITVTAARKQAMRFAPSYRSVTEQLIYRSGTRRPRKIEDLYDGILEVVNGTSHIGTLNRLKIKHPDLDWNVNTELESFDLMELVDKGLIDYTIANSNQVVLIRRFFPKLHVAFDLSEPRGQAWALPYTEDTSLYRATVNFFLDIKRSGKLDELIEKHFGYAGSLNYVGNCTFRKHFIQRFPQFKAYFVKAGTENDLDWRLLAAIGYQESHWDIDAVSPTGVRGIMMLTDATASQLGIEDRKDPYQSILGGARYFRLRKNRISPKIHEPDQTWMALAAYNVGHGHLEDARILTKQGGGNPNKWHDVKKFLPLLSEKLWYKRTKHGYARGREPVRYVENIRNYYDLMVWLTRDNPVKKQAGLSPDDATDSFEALSSRLNLLVPTL